MQIRAVFQFCRGCASGRRIGPCSPFFEAPNYSRFQESPIPFGRVVASRPTLVSERAWPVSQAMAIQTLMRRFAAIAAFGTAVVLSGLLAVPWRAAAVTPGDVAVRFLAWAAPTILAIILLRHMQGATKRQADLTAQSNTVNRLLEFSQTVQGAGKPDQIHATLSHFLQNELGDRKSTRLNSSHSQI